MATLEITVSDRKTGQIKARQIFELDDDLVRPFLEQLDTMLASLEQPLRVVKTIAPGGVTTIDLIAVPPVVSPSFEERYRRALPLLLEENPQ